MDDDHYPQIGWLRAHGAFSFAFNRPIHRFTLIKLSMQAAAFKVKLFRRLIKVHVFGTTEQVAQPDNNRTSLRHAACL